MKDLALGVAMREVALAEELPQGVEPSAQAAEFDASRVFDSDPVSHEAETQHHLSITYCRGDVHALEVLLAQSKRELQDAVYYCNQKAWGYWDTKVGAPTPEQATALVERMDSKFASFARDAHHLRALCADVSAALEAARAKAVDNMHERSRKSREAEDWAEFQTHEASERRRRFEQWRANR